MKPALALAALVLTGYSSAGAAPQQQPATSTTARPPEPTEDSVGLRYVGTVTGVTKNSITVRWPGEEKAKTFAASETLAAGGFPTKHRDRPDGRPAHTLPPEFRYRLSDVKAGDRVQIRFAHLGGADICDAICIDKRPGGLVPPLPDGAENLKPRVPLPPGTVFLFMIPYHEQKNAYWDLEDKGIPYPEKFGPFRRWPEAPMPRPVGATPAASPTISP